MSCVHWGTTWSKVSSLSKQYPNFQDCTFVRDITYGTSLSSIRYSVYKWTIYFTVTLFEIYWKQYTKCLSGNAMHLSYFSRTKFDMSIAINWTHIKKLLETSWTWVKQSCLWVWVRMTGLRFKYWDPAGDQSLFKILHMVSLVHFSSISEILTPNFPATQIDFQDAKGEFWDRAPSHLVLLVKAKERLHSQHWVKYVLECFCCMFSLRFQITTEEGTESNLSLLGSISAP